MHRCRPAPAPLPQPSTEAFLLQGGCPSHADVSYGCTGVAIHKLRHCCSTCCPIGSKAILLVTQGRSTSGAGCGAAAPTSRTCIAEQELPPPGAVEPLSVQTCKSVYPKVAARSCGIAGTGASHEGHNPRCATARHSSAVVTAASCTAAASGDCQSSHWASSLSPQHRCARRASTSTCCQQAAPAAVDPPAVTKLPPAGPVQVPLTIFEARYRVLFSTLLAGEEG